MTAPALHGDLAHFFPAEVLQLLMLAQASGRLDLQRGAERAAIWIERGRPAHARTSGGAVRTGEVLVHRRAASSDAVARALAQQQRRPGERIGELLVAAGATAAGEVEAAVREALRRVVHGVLLWREGEFRFTPGERLDEGEVRLDLDLDRLILDGLRQADEARAD